jgi:hypothetical protein
VPKRETSGPAQEADRDGDGGEELQIDLRGNPAAMLSATVHSERSPDTDDLSLEGSLVAGARNPLNLEFSWTAA